MVLEIANIIQCLSAAVRVIGGNFLKEEGGTWAV